MTFQITGAYVHGAWGAFLQRVHMTLDTHLTSEPMVQAALDERPTLQTGRQGPGWGPRQAAHRQALSGALRSLCFKVNVLAFPEIPSPRGFALLTRNP